MTTLERFEELFMLSGQQTAQSSMLSLLKQLVRREGHNGIDDDKDLVSYVINDALFDCIRAAPHPFNQERKLIERTG